MALENPAPVGSPRFFVVWGVYFVFPQVFSFFASRRFCFFLAQAIGMETYIFDGLTLLFVIPEDRSALGGLNPEILEIIAG